VGIIFGLYASELSTPPVGLVAQFVGVRVGANPIDFAVAQDYRWKNRILVDQPEGA
jgi:hypothetical protein